MKFSMYHWLMLIMAVVFLGAAFYFPLAYYDALPQEIPTHFNLGGEPDAWKSKTITRVIFGPIVTLPSLLIMGPVIWMVASAKDPRKMINGPKEKVEKISLEQAEKLRAVVVFHLLVIALLVALLNMFVSLGSILVALDIQPTLGWGPPVAGFLLLGDAIILTWQSLRLVNGK